MSDWEKWVEQFEKIEGMNPDDIMDMWVGANNAFQACSTEQILNMEEELCKRIEHSNPFSKLYFYSMLLSKTEQNTYTDLIFETVLQGNLPVLNQMYVMNQMNNWLFVKSYLHTEKSEQYFRKLYDRVYEYFLEQVRIPAHRIPLKERNHDFVLVLTGQMLQLEHGPTKTALDRCRVLMETLGKEVLLINVAETGNVKGMFPLFRASKGNYMPDLSAVEHYEYEGCKIPFFQFDLGMPEASGIQNLIDLIQENKPYAIVSIGAPCITADICDKVVPVLSISLCPSVMAETHTQYQQIGRVVSEQDRKLLAGWGKEENHVITGVFSSWLKPQEGTLTRSELGLPEDKKILVVVGGRLGEEVDDSFVEMMCRIPGEDAHWAFAGAFHGYEERCQKSEYLREHSTYVGMQSDILAMFECCDLYVNPTRMGGGTSSVEALSKGVPVITVNYGDVAVNAGEPFCVEDYEEMAVVIQRYLEDCEFYSQQCRMGKKRSEVLLDSAQAFADVMNELGRRMQNDEEGTCSI